jgi:hypothetical protein
LNFSEIDHLIENEKSKANSLREKKEAKYQEEQDRLQKIEQDKLAHMKEAEKNAYQKERQRNIRENKLDLGIKKQRLVILENELKRPNITIENSLNTMMREKIRNSFGKERILTDKISSFNHFLLKFGNPITALVALSMTIGLGIFWVWATLGLDSVGGNPFVTIGVAIVALICVDLIGYAAILGTLSGLANFLKSSFYHRMLEITLVTGFIIGLVCFITNLIFRIKEVGI